MVEVVVLLTVAAAINVSAVVAVRRSRLREEHVYKRGVTVKSFL